MGLVPLAEAFCNCEQLFERELFGTGDALLVVRLVVQQRKKHVISLPAEPLRGEFFVPKTLKGGYAIGISEGVGGIPAPQYEFGSFSENLRRGEMT